MKKTMLLVGTRKGLVTYKLDKEQWIYQSTFFEAIPVTIANVDPRDQSWWVCLDHGHWGIKLHRSTDMGQTWEALNNYLPMVLSVDFTEI